MRMKRERRYRKERRDTQTLGGDRGKDGLRELLQMQGRTPLHRKRTKQEWDETSDTCAYGIASTAKQHVVTNQQVLRRAGPVGGCAANNNKHK
jgi:hypothetical protein